MRAKSAVVLVIDRLGAGCLGPYGNTWLETPNFNRLAAQSVLCETVIAGSPNLDAAYRSFWTRRHAMLPEDRSYATLLELAAAVGKRSILVTDDSTLAEHPQSSAFSERQLVAAVEASESATEIEQTGLFAFFTAARDTILRQPEPCLLWLHSRGMGGPWDAPLELRYQFADEDDPQPADFVRPPEAMLGEDADPDEVLGYVHAHAGQVGLLDMCLGMLLDALGEHPLGQESLLIVTSPRGYPLGEHRRVGPCDEALYGEMLHVPLFARFPGDEHAMSRLQGVVQPDEVFSLVAEVCDWRRNRFSRVSSELQGEMSQQPKAAYATGNEQRAIRTPAWFMRESRVDGNVQRELFAKPDDRFEANEVSSRCGDVVELLAAELDRFESAAREGELAESPPLAEVLYDIWR